MKNKLIETMTNHGKPRSITDLCNILKCDTHHIRDILHNDPCFTQDAKTFLWSYNAGKDGIKIVENEIPEIPEIKKGYFIKRKQSGLTGHKISYEYVSNVLDTGIMVEDKLFIVPFSDITDIRTGNPVLNKGEVIYPIPNKTIAYTQNPVKNENNDVESNIPYIYHMEKITGDNRRPGMDKKHTYLVRHNHSDQFGWLCCSTFIDAQGAKQFIETLTNTEKKEEIMENNSETITLTTIIDNLNSSKKTETLKKAKSDLETFLNNVPKSENNHILKKALNQSVKTKTDFIEILVSYFDFLSTETVEEFDPVSVPEKELEKAKNENVENLEPEIKTVKTIETPSTIIPIHENIENITLVANSIERIVFDNSNAINQNNTEIKAIKSTMIIALNAMAEKIGELTNIVKTQNETINKLANNIRNFDVVGPHVPLTVAIDGTKKVVNEEIENAKKEAEKLKEERRVYVAGLGGAEKEVYTRLEKTPGNGMLSQDQICLALMDDYLGKDIKNALVSLNKIGLIVKVVKGDKSKKGADMDNDDKLSFKIAPINDFKGNVTKTNTKVPETKKSPEIDEKPIAKPRMKSSKKTLRSVITNAITEKPMTVKELVELTEKELEKEIKESSVRGVVGYQLPKAGIEVMTTKTEKGTTYQIKA